LSVRPLGTGLGFALPVIDCGDAGDGVADELDPPDDEATPGEAVALELELAPPLESVEAVLLVAVETAVVTEVVVDDAPVLAALLPLVPNGLREGPVMCDFPGVAWTSSVGIDTPLGGGEVGSWA
jgi:hypothetical protein